MGLQKTDMPSFDRQSRRGYAGVMKITAALVLTVTATTCSPPSDQAKREAREQAIASAAEAMCRDGGRASALSEIATIAATTPSADVAQSVFEAASDIEQSGCAQIVEANQAAWTKQDTLMADVETAAANRPRTSPAKPTESF